MVFIQAALVVLCACGDIWASPVSLEAPNQPAAKAAQPKYTPGVDYDTWGPNIGILTTPWGPDKEADKVSGFYDYYARWLEQSGARIVPIRYNAPREELDELFSSINGLLYTGGDLSLKFDTPYYKTAHYLYNKAIAANDEGDFFPIWGTCMGFQLISIMAAGDYSVLDHGVYDSDGIMLPLVPTEYASSSRMLARASKKLLHDIFEKPTTVNLHHDGIMPETWASNEKLSSFFDVISTNEDSKNRPFISTFEAKDYPIYGAQWHGEKVAFDFMDKTESNGIFINHSYEAVAVSQYFSNFFVSECRKSQHRFQSATEESNHLLYHFTPKIEGNSAVLYTFE